jgi:hypothetical protein
MRDDHNQLSFSRFNHWLPRAQAPPEVVQGVVFQTWI